MRPISTQLFITTGGIFAVVATGIYVGILLFQIHAAKNSPIETFVGKKSDLANVNETPPDSVHTKTDQHAISTIGANTVLHIVVKDEEDLSRKVGVNADGTIYFPLLAEIPALGRTPMEVQNDIQSRLRKNYVPRAEVSVLIDKVQE